MDFVPPGRHRDAAAFRDYLRQIDSGFDCELEIDGPDGVLSSPLAVGSLTVRNRFAIHPMEGWDGNADGTPSEHTLRRWRRFGESGAGLIWGGEAFAVRADGRANPNQLHLDDEGLAEGGLRALLNSVREGAESRGDEPDGQVIGLQLTHSGRFSRPAGPFAPRVAYRHPVLDSRVGVDSDEAILSDDELVALQDRYVMAARLAHRVGFQFVDVKACHGYLLHEMLSGRTRPGRYGGDFEGRTRFLCETVERVKSECRGLEVFVRLSVGDVHPYAADSSTGRGTPDGWTGSRYDCGFGVDPEDPTRFDFTETFALLRKLHALGVPSVNATVGSPYYCPHVQRPATYPPSDGYQPPEDPLLSVTRQLGAVRECKRAVPELVLVGTGYSYLQEWLPHVAQAEVRAGHVDVVGLGRMALIYPDLARDAIEGRVLERKRICRTFSDCTTAPRHGLISGCYPLDDHYKALPEFAQVKEIKRASKA